MDVAALLDELGLQRAPVVGNSSGGWTALELAKLGRATGVIALAPAGLWRRHSPRAVDAILQADCVLSQLLGGLTVRAMRTRTGRRLAACARSRACGAEVLAARRDLDRLGSLCDMAPAVDFDVSLPSGRDAAAGWRRLRRAACHDVLPHRKHPQHRISGRCCSRVSRTERTPVADRAGRDHPRPLAHCDAQDVLLIPRGLGREPGRLASPLWPSSGRLMPPGGAEDS